MKFPISTFFIGLDEKIVKAPLEKIKEDLKQYAEGKKFSFDYQIDLSKFSRFEQDIYNEMRKIPYGKTISYGELARRVGRPKACRAVGNACGKNPVGVIIPCHRVVGKDSIGGFTGPLEQKKYLINFEKGFKE